MTHVQIYKSTLLMQVMWCVCLLAQVIVFVFYWDFPNNTKSPTIALTLIFLLGLMFNPFPMFYRTPRFEIVKVLWEILISPFGLVKFRHFFLADVITSARLMLSDSTAMVCFYSSDDFRASKPIKCSWQDNVNYVWAIIPYWWRFWQCIHRYHGDRSNVN